MLQCISTHPSWAQVSFYHFPKMYDFNFHPTLERLLLVCQNLKNSHTILPKHIITDIVKLGHIWNLCLHQLFYTSAYPYRGSLDVTATKKIQRHLAALYNCRNIDNLSFNQFTHQSWTNEWWFQNLAKSQQLTEFLFVASLLRGNSTNSV